MLKIFKAVEASHLDELTMSRDGQSEVDAAGAAVAFEAGLANSAVIRLLFSSEEIGVSLAYAWFKPAAELPRHSHSSDCIYYVISGELYLGAETLKAGDGFAIQSGDLYRYVAGPQGVEVIEFRTETKFDIKFHSSKQAWEALARGAMSNKHLWETTGIPLAAQRMLNVDAPSE